VSLDLQIARVMGWTYTDVLELDEAVYQILVEDLQAQG
jgi:hypothetical protein